VPKGGSAQGAALEAFRVLRTNLQVLLLDLERPVIVVTSARPGEGKTSTSCGIASSFAAAGERIVIIDADLRHPDIHHRFPVENTIGLSEVLAGRATLADAVAPHALPSGDRLHVLPTGRALQRPAELLGSDRMAHVVEALSREADLVIIDSPPVLPVADTLALANLASGVLLVAEVQRTSYAELERAKEMLTRNRSRILGVVLNKQRTFEPGYGYGYGDLGQDEPAE
jgi:polysaccharide biosynthesis transport protein